MQLSDYFQVVSASENMLHFRLNGFWDDNMVNKVGQQFLDEFQRQVDRMPGRFITLVEAFGFKPYTDEAKSLVSQGMEYARKNGLYKTIEVLPDAVSKLSVKEAASSTGKDDFRVVVKSLEEGQAKAKELQKEL